MKTSVYQKNRRNPQSVTLSDTQSLLKTPLKPTALRLAILSLSMGVSVDLLAATSTPQTVTDTINDNQSQIANQQKTQTTNSISNKATNNDISNKDTPANAQTLPSKSGTTNNTVANAQDETQDGQDNQPYQYIPSQPAIDHISQEIANKTLTQDFNNFNQPVATLKRNQPSVGYNAKIAEASNAPIAVQNSNSNIANQNQAVNHAQVVEQLNGEATINKNDTTIAKQNAATQTDNIDVNATINPNDYLPEYQKQVASQSVPQQQSTVTAGKTNPVKKIYNKLLNKAQGVDYIKIKVANADEKQQPAKNIKAALEQVTVESVSDFLPSVGKLRQIALDAAEAVGYYNTEVSFKHLGQDKIEVTIKAGEPVIVKNRIVDIRGEGAEGDKALPVYQAIEEQVPPKEGDVFNHGVYKTSKAAIEGVASTNGYFDAQWLNSSADVILPDNTADVDLVYDTQGRYKFGDIKVYSIDKKGNLTDDPNKLPIKPKLLQQLMTYKKDDPYYQPYVTKFANNLSATRYFNGVDMDVVMPSNGSNGTLTSNNLGNPNTPATSTNTTNQSTTDNSSDGTEAKNNTSEKAADIKNKTDNASNQVNDDKNTAGTIAAASDTATLATSTQNPDDIAPINFDVDASTQERLQAISKKATNLLHAPEDIQLAPEQKNNSKNPLVLLANGVSKVAKKIDSHGEDTPLELAQAQQKDPIDKLTPEQVYQQKAVPTYVVLNANKPHEAQVGLGYETDVGVRLVGKLNNNLVNRNGLQAGVNIAASKVNQSIEVTASQPYKHPLNDKITGSIGYDHSDNQKIANTFESESYYANVARNIYRDTGWNRTYSLRYRTDKLTLSNGDKYDVNTLPYPFNNNASNMNQQSLLLGYALNKTMADNILTPNFGYNQRYSVEVGPDGLVNDTNLAILKAGATGIYSFGKDNKQQVLGRVDLGYIYSGDFENVPYRLRFFAGGDQSIRGYNNDSLSPEFGDKHFLTGGDALAVGSLEYNYELRPGLRTAVFSDFGNAYDTTGKYDNSTKVGVGAGVRWASPIGTVRLDVASGISDGGDPIRIHFFIGSPL